MGRYELHSVHQFQHLGRVARAVRYHREASLDDAVSRVVRSVSRLRLPVFPAAREGRTGILGFQPVNNGFDPIDILIADIILGEYLGGAVDV